MTFFKLPIHKLVEKLPAKFNFTKFNPSQQAMLDGLEQHRFWVHISARRTGKSIAAAVLALGKLLEPNQQVIVVAPNYDLSSIIWDYVKDIIESLQIETKKLNVKDRVIQLINGSTLRLMSANNRGSLIGRAANLLIIDEAAIIENSEYFDRDLRPALSTFPDSRAVFISTPRGKENYLYKYYQRGQNEEDKDWGSATFPWYVNPALQLADIEEAKKIMTEAIFRQEYFCDWLVFEGQIYKIKEEHLVDLTGKSYQFAIAGLDMGFRDETAFAVIGGDGYGNYAILDEYVAKEGTTSTHASFIKELIDKWKVEQVYIDSSAQQTKADLAYDYDIFCSNAIKSVNDGIASLQSLVEGGKLVFDKNNARQTYHSMASYKWNVNTNKPTPVHDEHSHSCDAVRYAIYTYQKSSAISVYAG